MKIFKSFYHLSFINVMKCFPVLSTFLICFVFLNEGQSQDTNDYPTRYMTNPKWEKILNRQPNDQKKWMDFERLARHHEKHGVMEEQKLALVFNVIDIGGKAKVTEEKIFQQIQVLNDAFSGKMKGNRADSYGHLIAGDSKISFCIGSPNGKEPAINFKVKTIPYEFENLFMINDEKEGIEGERKDEYINIWITEMPDTMAGYAVLPDHDFGDDGIFIDPDFFGIQKDDLYYNSGKTLIHLLGRYLGLLPLWTNFDCSDDGVEDTPIHNSPNDRCYGEGHISLCYGYQDEMVGNFMDSNPDDCAYMFTKGQVARMHAALSDYGYRSTLKNGIKLCDPNIIPEDKETVVRTFDDEIFDFEIIPNPAQTNIEVVYRFADSKSDVVVEISNDLGQILRESKVPALGIKSGRTNMNISDLPSGSYFVTLMNSEKIITKTLIKIE